MHYQLLDKMINRISSHYGSSSRFNGRNIRFIPLNDFTYTLIPNNDLTYTLIPGNDFNVDLLPNNDLLFTLIPNNDILYSIIPNNDGTYLLIPNNDLGFSLLFPTPNPTPTLTPTPTITETLTPTPTITETLTPTPTITLTPTPTSTPAPLGKNILYLGDGNVTTNLNSLQDSLLSLGYVASIDGMVLGTTYVGGDIAGNYDLVIMQTNGGQNGAPELSTNLSNFITNGGHFIGQTFLWSIYPSGFDFEKTPFVGGVGQSSNGGPITTVVSHPVLGNYTPTNVSGLINTVTTMQSDATLVLKYNDDTPLLGVKEIGSSRTVGINVFGEPTSGSTVGQLMANAVLWCLGMFDEQPTPTPTITETLTPTPTITLTPTITETPAPEGAVLVIEVPDGTPPIIFDGETYTSTVSAGIFKNQQYEIFVDNTNGDFLSWEGNNINLPAANANFTVVTVTGNTATLRAVFSAPTMTPTPTLTPTPTVTETVTPTITPTITETLTPTVTPTLTDTIPVTGYSFNLVDLPYNFPSSGNSIMNATTGQTGTTLINELSTTSRGFYFNKIDNEGIDRISYYSGFTGHSVTITLTQNNSTAIYSGDTNSFKFWSQGGVEGFVFGTNIGVPPTGTPSGSATRIQSAPTPWVIGQPVYVSLSINPTPTPTPTTSSKSWNITQCGNPCNEGVCACDNQSILTVYTLPSVTSLVTTGVIVYSDPSLTTTWNGYYYNPDSDEVWKFVNGVSSVQNSCAIGIDPCIV